MFLEVWEHTDIYDASGNEPKLRQRFGWKDLM